MTLEQRVVHLEKRCRRLTGVLIGIMALSAVIVLGGAAAQEDNADKETVRTRQLEIVDGDGKVRIHLGKADEGYGVVLYDENGRFNATFTDAPLGAVLQLSKDGSGLRLQAAKDGAGLSIRDTKGKPRAMVLVSDDKSQMVLKDQEGSTVFTAPQSD